MAEKNQNAATGLIWARLAQANQDKQPSLSHEQIVGAALKLTDNEGLDALSMRRLATELHVGTMSLYWYVARKEDLLDLLVDAAFAEMELPETPSGDWRADLSLLARQTRSIMLHHPWLASLVGTRPGLGPHWLKRLEFSFAAIDHLGLSMPDMAAILSSVDGYVIGFVLRELEEAQTRQRTGMSESEWQVAITPYIQQVIKSGNYPYFTRYIQETEERDSSEGFTFGLNCLLEGIATYIDQHKRTGRGQAAAPTIHDYASNREVGKKIAEQ